MAPGPQKPEPGPAQEAMLSTRSRDAQVPVLLMWGSSCNEDGDVWRWWWWCEGHGVSQELAGPSRNHAWRLCVKPGILYVPASRP